MLHPTDLDATILLGPSDGGLGGQDDLDGFPASERNAYLSKTKAFSLILSEIVKRLNTITFTVSID